MIMNNRENLPANIDDEALNLDELEKKLNDELELQMSELESLKRDAELIGNTEALGKTIQDVVWEQFCNQIGIQAGKDFIKENNGLNLDLRKSAHIQTTENFANGKIASHNTKINYQERYNDWQANFVHDANGNVVTHNTRSGKREANLVQGARDRFDKGRPTGSYKNKTDMDHTVSAAEIIRDPAANAHLSKEEQVKFANSDKNLNEMDSAQNRSKGDKRMKEWLDTPNSKGQTPKEIFEIDEKLEKKYREKDKEAREELKKVKEEGEKRSIETGEQSRKEEAFRISGSALKAAMMALLADFVKTIIRTLIQWLASSKKTFAELSNKIKKSISDFVGNLKERLLNAGNALLTTVFTAIFGPVINLIKKAWIFLKQGYSSIKSAIAFLKDPKNKNMPFSLKILEVGKIVTAGIAAAGAIALGGAIEGALSTIPVFAIEIPLLGSLASILGIFFGAVISGIIGAIALNLINKAVESKQKSLNAEEQFKKRNEILANQQLAIHVSSAKLQNTKQKTEECIIERHRQAANIIRQSAQNVIDNVKKSQSNQKIVIEDKNKKDFDKLFSDLDNL